MAKYAYFEHKDGASNNRQLMQAIIKNGEIVGWIKVTKFPPKTVVDEDYVAEKIEEADPAYQGTYNSMADIEAIQDADANDWAYLVTKDENGNDVYSRYRYAKPDGQTEYAWIFEVAIKRDNFTDQEWNAITSGITSELVGKLGDLPNNADLIEILGGKADVGADSDNKDADTIYGVRAFVVDKINTESDFQKNFASIMALTSMPEFATTLSVTTTGWKLVVTDQTYGILMGKRSDDSWYFADNLNTILDEVISGYTPI